MQKTYKSSSVMGFIRKERNNHKSNTGLTTKYSDNNYAIQRRMNRLSGVYRNHQEIHLSPSLQFKEH